MVETAVQARLVVLAVVVVPAATVAMVEREEWLAVIPVGLALTVPRLQPGEDRVAMETPLRRSHPFLHKLPER